MKRVVALVVVLLLSAVQSFSQTGNLSGKITDKFNNEALIGANVIISGTSLGAASDIDGTFLIKDIPAGTYDVKVSYISYQTLSIEKVVIKSSPSTTLNISLTPSSNEITEVVITAEALKNSESSVLKMQKNSGNIIDGVSAELISKNNSSDGTDILKRMTGVTISDGKFAFIRGIGDRYNNTMLNGANLPSTDPEKKSFSYDIFPAGLIENVITSKTFTPDKPADFSGGLVQINTIEFPSRFFLELGYSASYNTLSSLREVNSYQGGKTDFLGFDDGTREMPTGISENKVSRGTLSDHQLQVVGRSFSNDWNTNKTKTPLNGNYKFSIGNKLELGENTLGYIGSLLYSNSSEYKEIQSNSYTFDGPRYNYKGNTLNNAVSWGSLLNLSYKFGGTNKVSLKNIYNQNADDEIFRYEGDYRGADQFRSVTAMRYVSRSLYSSQLTGEHSFNVFDNTKFDWNLSYSNSKRDEPDGRRYVYSRDVYENSEPLRFQMDQSLATKYYGKLNDNIYGFAANFIINFSEDPTLPHLKTGITVERKERTFDARTFGFKNNPGGDYLAEDSILQGDVYDIFAPENFNSQFIEVIEITQPSDSYLSNQSLLSGYLMTDYKVLDNLRVTAGVRNERSRQEMISKSLTGEPLNVSPLYNDFLPSVNVTYSIGESINLRAGYNQTLARPEFREMAPFSYFDFQANELVQGNPNLKRALIKNYDTRFELFPAPGELFAVSVFYKKFTNPIEEILIASSSFEPIRSFENAVDAENYGVEFEVRKNLGFISLLKNFSVTGNISLIKSSINTGIVGGFQSANRPLQGQADYIINTGLYYDNDEAGFSASIVYNKVGEKIDKVGFAGLGDVLEKPRDQIDFSISKTILSNFKLKLSVKDLLAQDVLFIQKTPLGDKTSYLENRGSNITLGFSYQL